MRRLREGGQAGKSRRMRPALVTLLLALAACGDPTRIDGTNYDRTCGAASDCAAVFFGDQCEVCACPNAALNGADRTRYEADRTQALLSCGPQPAIGCTECPAATVSCTDGTCALQ